VGRQRRADPSALIARDQRDRPAALGAKQGEELAEHARITPLGRPHQAPAVVADDAHDVALAAAMADLVDADPAKALQGVGHPCARSATTRARIPPTPRQEMRKSRVIAVLEHWVANQAAWSSKSRVCRAPWRAQGTRATITPCAWQRTRGASAST
jgi:hypothetical protein